ncbi:MAG TPA: zinc ribbon domain-containing protein [Herpetosiphonaceae bacterium]
MTCPTCNRSNPEDARFCIYCSTQLTPRVTEVQEAQSPAVGPTTRLPESSAPIYTMPASVPNPAPAIPHVPGHISRGLRHGNEVAGAFFLIGLGVLFLTGTLFPGILVLLGVTAFISQNGREHQNKGLAALIFFTGLAVLFWTNSIFPGILILFGIMALLNSRLGLFR